MKRYMLDTDISSYILRGKSPRLGEKLDDVGLDVVCISVITRAELLYGSKRLPPANPLHEAIERYFKQVRTLAWDPAAASYYADIRHQLVTSGQPIGELDMMIAAHSLSAGAILVTNNTRHYERITQPLSLENWKI